MTGPQRLHRVDIPADLEATDARLRAWYARDAMDVTAPAVLAAAVDGIPAAVPPGRSWLGLAGWPTAVWGPASRSAIRLVLVGLLVLLLVVAALVVGSQIRRVPEPFGLAATGQLAFDAEGDIWIADPDGSGARPLRVTSDREWGATWSRDGGRIAFWSAGSTPGRAVLWTMAADGSDAHAVVPGSEFRVAAEAPAVSWSPDGRRLALATSDGELYVVGQDGTDLRRIGPSGLASVATPAWSPSGEDIAFRGQRAAFGPSTLYVVGSDGTGLEMVSAPGTGSEGSHLLADWSPDGRLVYSDGQGDIVLAERDPTGPWVERVLVGGPTEDIYPAWSPDGAWVVFVRVDGSIDDAAWAPDGNDAGRLFLVAADGGEPTGVSDDTLVAAAPGACWAPDATTVRVLVAQRPVVDTTAVVPRFAVVDVRSGRVDAQIEASDARGWAACSWQRLVP